MQFLQPLLLLLQQALLAVADQVAIAGGHIGAGQAVGADHEQTEYYDIQFHGTHAGQFLGNGPGMERAPLKTTEPVRYASEP
ncbi:hypothetical protein D3C80_1939300 [compost metagenome]